MYAGQLYTTGVVINPENSNFSSRFFSNSVCIKYSTFNIDNIEEKITGIDARVGDIYVCVFALQWGGHGLLP